MTDRSDYDANVPAVAEAARAMVAALTWLLDDMGDAGETNDPESGTEYDSVTSARAALAQAKAAGIEA